jgi:hypothetical protein
MRRTGPPGARLPLGQIHEQKAVFDSFWAKNVHFFPKTAQKMMKNALNQMHPLL